MTNEQKMNLAQASWSAEVTVRWTMFQLFFLIHSGALSLVLIQFKSERDSLTRTGVCGVGLLLAILWLLATYRAQKLVDYWHRKMSELEEEQETAADREKREGRRVDVFFDPWQKSKVPSPAGVPIYVVLLGLAVTFVSIWMVLLISSVLQLLQAPLMERIVQ